MRCTTPLGVALAVAALAGCRQTVYLDVADGGGGGSFNDGGLSEGGVPDCSGPPIALKANPPNVVVALDRSTGMSAINTRFGDSTPLAAARDALDLYAMRYQKSVRFGYVEFPGASFSCNSQTACCASAPSLPNSNFQAFEYALHLCEQDSPSCPVTDQRPMTAALANVLASWKQFLMSTSDGTKNYLLLITNGEPDCGSPQGACSDAAGTVNQLANYGVATTVIVPVPSPFDDACLAQIALQGGAPAFPYYDQPSSPADLKDTIGQMTHTIATKACQLDAMTSAQIRCDNVALYWKGTPVPCDRNNGWWSGNGFTIDLNGSWCDRLIEGDPQADFTLNDCSAGHH